MRGFGGTLILLLLAAVLADTFSSMAGGPDPLHLMFGVEFIARLLAR